MRKFIDPWVILGLVLAAFIAGIVLYGAPAEGATPTVSVSTECGKTVRYTKATAIRGNPVKVKVTTSAATEVTIKIGKRKREYVINGTRTFRVSTYKYAVYYFHDGQMVFTYGYNNC